MDGSKEAVFQTQQDWGMDELTGLWQQGKHLHGFKSDRVPALRGRPRHKLYPCPRSPLQLTSTCKGKLVICNGVSLELLTTLKGGPYAQQ